MFFQQTETKNYEIDMERVPQHIAIIMDGNGRWAKKRFLPRKAGHKAGAETLERIIEDCRDLGVKHLTVYAFSTENWNRKPEEVNFLMDLLAQTLKNELKEMNENNVVISFIGDTTKLSPKLQEILRNSVETTKNNTGVNLQIAFNYGSRDEIVHAVREIIASGEKDITEDTISKHLYTRNIPEPDLLIRTGGEMRVSNYLLWQIAYSEFIVLSKFWPEFDKDVLAECILEYKRRNRRFGK